MAVLPDRGQWLLRARRRRGGLGLGAGNGRERPGAAGDRFQQHLCSPAYRYVDAHGCSDLHADTLTDAYANAPATHSHTNASSANACPADEHTNARPDPADRHANAHRDAETP